MTQTPIRSIAVVAVLATVTPTFAGDLDPPGGVVSETMKTLVEVEPRTIVNAENTPGDADSVFRIASSGSYYLQGNITVITGESCIEIAADDVTLDLMGFEIRGFDAGTLSGIRVPSGARNILIRNGTIQGFGDYGIEFASLSESCAIENVRISDCGRSGMRLIGDSFRVIGCSVKSNGERGMFVGGRSVVRECTAFSNGDDGIYVGGGSVVVECTSAENTGSPSNPEDTAGIEVGLYTVVSRCAVWDNSGDGIHATSGSLVESCTARLNDRHGIYMQSSGVVRGNTCHSNGVALTGAGIYVEGSEARVEGNHCRANHRGIRVDGAECVIVGNTCAASLVLEYELAANNFHGPIIDLAGAATPAVSGSAALGVMGSSDPWANFSH